MKCSSARPSVAVIGAGMAGATCAQALAASGCVVHIADKARGAGGRLATRRLTWLDAQGQPRTARVDHGAPAFVASGADFRQFLATALPADAVVPWRPTLAAGSRPLDEAGPLSLPQPDMPSLCRALLRDIPSTFSFPVDRLLRSPLGWQVDAAGATLPGQFDAVVLALPPAQALSWDVARPGQGPLDWVMHDDARPGRERRADEVHWVAHARAGWSRQQLEQPAEWVKAQLQAALQEWLGEPVAWQHAVVHRWRYARPQALGPASAQPFWWDGVQGLGVCGDFLGGIGVEGAWLSARALIEAMAPDLEGGDQPAAS